MSEHQGDIFRAPVADPIARATRILDVAVRRHKPVGVWAMFSGGHDSVCAAHVASRHPDFRGCVHIDTGIGIEQTREYVRSTCLSQGWPLFIYRAVDEGQVYAELVKEYGFPGPFHHRKMYNRLKERCIRRMTREAKTKHSDRVMLVTGVRRDESVRRMGTVQTINREGARVWVAPLVDWSGIHKNEYMERHSLPRNEVVDLLHMSGECLCGAFAHPGELDEIAEWFPETVAHIRRIEETAKCAGVPCKWGERPPEETFHDPDQTAMPLCVSCEHGYEIRRGL